MIEVDEDALRCDLAETYHIYDYESLPVHMVAIFSCGLRDDSRIKMKLGEQRITTEQGLMALMVDRLSYLVWAQTKDAQKGKNKPQSVYELMVNPTTKKERDYQVFESPEEFELAMQIAERR